MTRINIETIDETLKYTGWKRVTEQYKNLKTPMQFRCPEGHLVETTWEKLRRKQTCPVCLANFKVRIMNIDAKKKEEGVSRIIGIDQASYNTGWSIYDNSELVAYGVFTTSKNESLLRIVDVCDWLNSMIDRWKPNLVGIEDIQYNPRGEFGQGTGNHNTFKLLGQLMGAVMLTVARMKVEVASVNNKVWKAHCKIKGANRAQQKKSAQVRVKEWHDVMVEEDVSDAICIGKYFAETMKGEEKKGIGDFR